MKDELKYNAREVIKIISQDTPALELEQGTKPYLEVVASALEPKPNPGANVK